MRNALVVAALMMGLACAGSRSQAPSSQTFGCHVDSAGRTSGPSADICDQIVRRWCAILDTTPDGGDVRATTSGGLAGVAGGRRWSLAVPHDPSNAAPATRRADGQSRYFAANIIPHEAGHQALTSYLDMAKSADFDDYYGSAAPDWLDEAFAVWMESAGERARRMRAVFDSAPSLERLVTMMHPNAGFLSDPGNAGDARVNTRMVEPPCARCTFRPESLRTKYRITDAGIDRDGKPDTLVWYSDVNPNHVATFEERQFYPLSYSLLNFIRQRGGAAAVRELIQRVRRNPSPRMELILGLPGLPKSGDAFEREWRAFLREEGAEAQ